MKSNYKNKSNKNRHYMYGKTSSNANCGWTVFTSDIVDNEQPLLQTSGQFLNYFPFYNKKNRIRHMIYIQKKRELAFLCWR